MYEKKRMSTADVMCALRINTDDVIIIDLMEEIDEKAEGYLLSVRTLSPEKRSNLLAAIQKLFGKSREFGDDKVQLAMQTYEMVCESSFYAPAIGMFRLCVYYCYSIYPYVHTRT